MSAGRTASFCLIVCFLLCCSEAQENVRAELGQNATLPCQVPNDNNKTILVVKWSRPEQEPEYVFLYRDEKFISVYQHPSYKNRVDLQDKEMKDGDFSLILKDVMMNDTGTYKCYVVQGEINSGKRSLMKLINTIHLEVYSSGDPEEHKDGGDKDGGDKDGGDKDGGDKDEGNMVGISLGVVGLILLVVAAVGFLVYKRHIRRSIIPHHHSLPRSQRKRVPRETEDPAGPLV